MHFNKIHTVARIFTEHADRVINADSLRKLNAPAETVKAWEKSKKQVTILKRNPPGYSSEAQKCFNESDYIHTFVIYEPGKRSKNKTFASAGGIQVNTPTGWKFVKTRTKAN